MNRRKYLTLLGSAASISIAGCTETPDSQSQQTETQTTEAQRTENTQTPQDEKQESIYYSLDIEPSLDEFPLEYSVQKIAGGYDSEERPLTLRIELSNPTDSVYYFSDSSQALFYQTESQSSQYKLYPNESVEENFIKRNGCWSAQQFYGMSQNYITEELSPGETKVQEVVLAFRNQGLCPTEPPSTLVFQTDIFISENVWSESKQQVSVGLTLSKETEE